MAELTIGIDTGGTYTDAVLFDNQDQNILKTTKTLTTHYDLSTCILSVLDELLPRDPSQINLVAISTTLATNAIVEKKGRPVALFLLGYDPSLVNNFKFENSFATPNYYYFEGGHDVNGREKVPLDLEKISEKAEAVKCDVEAFAVSGYFSPLNTSHEQQVFETIHQKIGYPVVLGHQLSSKLDSIQRATTASLNASLLSILEEFSSSMRSALDERRIKAPLMFIGSDGAMIGAEMMRKIPVSTIHSGPAASAIGGRFLSKQEKALVIDIGGTTTDIGIIDNGKVTVKDDGTWVGEYQTAVRAADIHSFGLGGDSLISFDETNKLLIGPNRVTPISYLAHSNPAVASQIRGLEARLLSRASVDYVEYWFLQREPRKNPRNERARQVIDLLREAPMPLPKILESLNIFHPMQFGGQSLINEGVIGRAALTPTDIMHLTGDFTTWDITAARKALEFIAVIKDLRPDELIQEVMEQIVERILAEVVSFISGYELIRRPVYSPLKDLGQWFFEESLYQDNNYLGASISLKMPIIGIGAPAGIFLPKVADYLDCELILPPHYQVANAVGTVASSIIIMKEAHVFGRMRGMNLLGYTVQVGEDQCNFTLLQEALEYARGSIIECVTQQALEAGANEPAVTCNTIHRGGESFILQASAMGNPRLDN